MWQDQAMNRIIPAISFPLLLLVACSGQSDPAPAGSDATAAVAEASEALPPPATDPVGGPASRYTSLKDCKVEELREDEDWSVSRCAGPGGYTLMVDYGDARDDLRLVRPGGKPVELGLLSLNGGGFNSLGDAVEWRGTGTEAAFKPTMLIVRNNAVESPERPEQPTALLVVIDLKQGCAVAQIRPTAGQNETARKIADGPRQPCLKGR
jgi:hypothetical protein